ncbi:hypothetical protein [Streptomyces sp. NBC_01803]|uniref:hypothetical protein n=1 Tax=Streptomyces sp. NBC_01803 TaxID=2975946 RepID=UPI002DDACB58|nr:hypothetical protein [Streptomyces sp. NBC_01803]WSA45009.1 hypothetical protein OIE51_12765 [Streptomyces sp. NBC_01803]
MSLINPDEGLLARLMRGASTTDLYDIAATALTEMKAREDADGLHEVRIQAEFGEIRYEADENRFTVVFWDEGTAALAAEQTGTEAAR